MSINTKVKEGAQLVPFVRLFDVEPVKGNKGQLMLRKEELHHENGMIQQGLIATMFFNCGMSYGAQVPCNDRKHQDQLFAQFNQDDANAISKHAYKEVSAYVEKIVKDEPVKVEAKTIKMPNLDKF